MRARRTAYIVIFVVACLVAGLLYYLQVPRASVVRATADIPAMTQITADMVELVKVAPVDVSTDAAQSTNQVVGQYAAMPILAGQEIDKRALDRTPGQQQFGFGAALDPGDVAFAIPISDPSQAVGGALSPGAKVTVVAVPNALKNGVAGLSGSDVDRPRDEPDDPGPSHAKRADLHPDSVGLRDRRGASEARQRGRRDTGEPALGLRNGRLELDLLPRALGARRHCLDVLIRASRDHHKPRLADSPTIKRYRQIGSRMRKPRRLRAPRRRRRTRLDGCSRPVEPRWQSLLPGDP